MKIRSLHHLLTLCLLALLAARAGALTIVQTATVPLVQDTSADYIYGSWDFDPFAPAGGGTLTGASLKTTLPLLVQAHPFALVSWSSSFILGDDAGFYSKVLSRYGYGGSFELIEFTETAFTPSQLAHFQDPSQSQLRFEASSFAYNSDPFSGLPFNTSVSGSGTFVLTYEYETASANVPEAGSTALFLGAALAGLWTAARRRAFLAL